MNKIKFILIVFALIAFNTAKAQLPFGDSAWVLQTALSDEFDSSAVKLNKWFPNWWPGDSIFNGAEVSTRANLISTGTTLQIRADTLDSINGGNYYVSDPTRLLYGYNVAGHGLTYAYSGGVICSNHLSYKYGYFEFRMKMPSNYYGPWPGPWVLGRTTTPTAVHSGEIDIAENSGFQSFMGNVVGNNYHGGLLLPPDTVWNTWHRGTETIVLPPGDSLSGAFHKYAMQWDSVRVTWYFDDKPTFELYDPSGFLISHNYSNLIINQCVDPARVRLPSDWVTNQPPNVQGLHYNIADQPTRWPQILEIDYARYYTLQADCNTNATICAPANYDRKVKQSISTNPGCSPSFSPSTPTTSYALRATESILIDVNATIEPTGGAYFMAEVVPCPQ